MDARLLPEAFQTWYEALHVRSLRDGSENGVGRAAAEHEVLEKADGQPVGQWRVGSGQTTSIGKKSGGPKTKQVGKTSRFMGDERAWNFKRKVDKRLRQLAREIRAELDKLDNPGGVSEPIARRCSGKCKRFGEISWNYCTNCGAPMREVDSEEMNR